MARKSRKNIVEFNKVEAGNKVKVCRTAAYIRLSVEDSDRRGDTLESQRSLVMEYIENEPVLALSGLYCDNGSSGTNFERPDFERLMKDVKKGLIDCIVVKDLSRFGRNYKETGNFIERIFPFLGIRFIAINDHFDTLQGNNDGYIMPLKNLVNEFYCKDLSKKITTVLEAKQLKGEYIGSWAPYGYCRSEGNIHKLEINMVTAPVVQRIFKWVLAGVPYMEVERRLNSSDTACPFKYLHQLGLIKNNRYEKVKWSSATIKQILSNPVYLGHMVQGRHKQSFYEGKKRYVVSPTEWKVVENTHTALVSKDEFEEVQELKRKKSEKYHDNKRKYEHLNTENIFSGKVYCASCHHAMIRDKQVYGKEEKRAIFEFVCYTHAHSKQCHSNYLLEDKMREILFDVLQQQIQVSVRLSELLAEVNQELSVQKNNISLVNKRCSLSRNLIKCNKMREVLYKNFVDNLVSEKEFKTLMEAYTREIKQNNHELTELEELQKKGDSIQENKYLKEFGKFRDVSVLNREIVEALVEKIYVDKGNLIEIVLRYQDYYADLIGYIEEKTVRGDAVV